MLADYRRALLPRCRLEVALEPGDDVVVGARFERNNAGSAAHVFGLAPLGDELFVARLQSTP